MGARFASLSCFARYRIASTTFFNGFPPAKTVHVNR